MLPLTNAGSAISQLLGWTSTIAWSISFYPQVVLNYRRKSVTGLSLGFIYLNVEGFLAYSIYNTALFASHSVREEYRRRHAGHDSSVRGNDVAFAVHALTIASVTLAQTVLYKADAERISSTLILFVTMTGILAISGMVAAAIGSIAWLDALYFLSYLKLAISLIKYIPQAWLNYQRKSTTGWSIYNILLDLFGGLTSEAQLFLDAYLSKDWNAIWGNLAKLILALLAILFDLVFIVQHYVLYRHSAVGEVRSSRSELEAANDDTGVTESSPLLHD